MCVHRRVVAFQSEDRRFDPLLLRAAVKVSLAKILNEQIAPDSLSSVCDYVIMSSYRRSVEWFERLEKRNVGHGNEGTCHLEPQHGSLMCL